MLFARINANLGKLHEALTQCTKAISKNKLSSEAYYLISSVEAELGNMEAAYKSITKALYLNPDLIIAHFTKGNIARNQMKCKDANKSYENALDLLNSMKDGEIIPESDGITAGRLKEIINSVFITA